MGHLLEVAIFIGLLLQVTGSLGEYQSWCQPFLARWPTAFAAGVVIETESCLRQWGADLVSDSLKDCPCASTKSTSGELAGALVWRWPFSLGHCCRSHEAWGRVRTQGWWRSFLLARCSPNATEGAGGSLVLQGVSGLLLLRRHEWCCFGERWPFR